MAHKNPELLHIEELVRTKLPSSPVYALLLSPVIIRSATKGHFIARLTLSACHMNSAGSLHGSVSATIVDWAGGMAVAACDLRHNTGVSVDIHVTYQSGAREGDDVEIEGSVDRMGGSLAFTKVNIFRVENGTRSTIVASGTHTKFIKGTGPSTHPPAA